MVLVVALACGWWVAVGGWERRSARRFMALCGVVAGWGFFAVMERIVSAGQPAQWASWIKAVFLSLLPILFFYFLSGWTVAGKGGGPLQPAARSRLRYLRSGALTGGLGYGLSFLHPAGGLALAAGLLLMAYALVEERLRDPEMLLRRVAIEAAVYALCLFLFWLLAFGVGGWVASARGGALPGAFALLGAALAVGLARPLERRISRWVDRNFFEVRSRSRDTLKAASAGMSRVRNLKKLINLMVRVVARSMKPSHATVLLRPPGQDYFEVAASHGPLRQPVGGLALEERSALISWLERATGPVVHEELEIELKRAQPAGESYATRRVAQALREMERLQAAVCVPSFVEQRLQGILVLGKRKSGRMYAPEDLDIFSTLADRAAFAVENAQAYEELRDTRDQLVQSERLATIGKFAFDMAHEIKNPLQAILTYFEYLPEQYDDPNFRDRFARVARAEAQRISALVRALADFSNPKPPAFETIDLHEVAESVLGLLANDLRREHIDARRAYGPDRLIAEADRDQIKQILLNLFLNAAESMGAVPEDRRALEIRTAQAADAVRIEVRDTGCGIPEEKLPQIFAPFFTTKTKGSGLGLAIVQNIVKAHSGRISVESKVGAGTTVTLTLPIRQGRRSV